MAIKAANGDDFTEKNRAHWDQNARTYTSQPWQQEMIARINSFLAANAEWLGLPPRQSSSADNSNARPIRVLDYACGPGTVTAILGPRANEWKGIDLSAEMCKMYNERFASVPESDKALKPFTAHATNGNLLREGGDEGFGGPEWQGFDMVCIGLGFHHFEDLPLATKTLVERLRPGGVFMIVDLVTHEPEESTRHLVAHAGFDFEKVRGLFEGQGLQDVQWRVMEEEVLIRGTMPRRVFVAKGRKPE